MFVQRVSNFFHRMGSYSGGIRKTAFRFCFVLFCYCLATFRTALDFERLQYSTTYLLFWCWTRLQARSGSKECSGETLSLASVTPGTQARPDALWDPLWAMDDFCSLSGTKSSLLHYSFSFLLSLFLHSLFFFHFRDFLFQLSVRWVSVTKWS